MTIFKISARRAGHSAADLIRSPLFMTNGSGNSAARDGVMISNPTSNTRRSILGVYQTMLLIACMLCCAAATTKPVLFTERFENARLQDRGWYDGDTFRIVTHGFSGECIEYEWTRDSKVTGSSPVRRLFEPTDEIYVRFHLRLSKDFAWTGKGF